MSDAREDERERIREQKKRELRERLENGGDSGDDESDPPTEPIAIEGENHLSEVVATYDVVLTDWYADWCGPCQMLDPTIEALAGETDAAVAKIDIDANQRLAQQMSVRGVPTIILYADGDLVERTSGVQDRATLQQWIESYS